MSETVIVSAVRTAIGGFGGSLKDVSAVELGTLVIKTALERAGLPADSVDEVIMGNVLGAGLGQNIARQMAVHAGIPVEIPSMTINKVCGSGLRAVSLASQIIKAGDADCIVVGGAENMSQVPYILPGGRWGMRMGDSQVIDTMVHDGLYDIFNKYHMGITAENIAEQWNISREEQDAFAHTSQERAAKAISEGAFKNEIVPVSIPQRKGDPVVFDTDEHPRLSSLDKMAKLRPAFKKDGTVTAANASGINDGACALVLMSREAAQKAGAPIVASIRGYGSAGVDPSIMGYGPVPSSRKALKMAGWTVSDLDLIEANEAFAAQSLAVVKDLELDPEIVNVNGGAIALGHPIGCSGARILTTLIYAMKARGSRRGLATLCIGGGMGAALCIEREEA